MLKLLQGFKDFIMRGNVVDLAVGIVIGAAFTTVVSAFTNSFLKPMIQAFGGGGGEVGGTFKINGAIFDWAAFVNAAITFILTAAVVYFLVVTPMNRLAERRHKGLEPEPKAPPEDIILLREIRDALIAQQPVTTPASATTPATAETPKPRIPANDD